MAYARRHSILTPEQIHDLLSADLLFSGSNPTRGGLTFIAARTVLAFSPKDIETAARQASLLQDASTGHTIAVLICAHINPEDFQSAREQDVAVIHVPAA